MNSEGQLYEACLPILLDKVPNLANVRNAEGMSLLGYELLHKDYNYKRCQISSYLEPFLDESDGTEVNNANVLKYFYIPLLEEQTETIETNVNTVLKSCRIHPTTNNVICNDDSNHNKYVHPLIFLAATGKSLLGTCLDMPKIPFLVKFDALEIAGANFAKWGYYTDAVDCWNAANCIRQQIVTLKNKNSENIQEYVSKWEKDIHISDEIAEELLNPYEEYVDMDTVYIDFDEDSRSIIQPVEESFKIKLNTGTVPDIVVHSPTKSFVSHLHSLNSRKRGSDKVSSDSEDEEEQIIKTRIAILTKSVLIHERLIGFGCHQTMRAFHALAIEYKRHDKVQEFVTVMTYSFPYLVKYIPQEEYYAVNSITKTYTLTKFIDSLTNVLLTETKRRQLSFDLLMAIFKCFFLHGLATPRKQRDFSQFAPLLLAIKCLHRFEKTDEEDRRFSQFLRKVLKDDLRNDVRQSLLHYATPVTNKASDKLEKEIIGLSELVEILLSSGADPNTEDKFGMMPLHLAYRSIELNELVNDHYDNQMNIIQALLGAGAHTDCIDAANRTPIWYSQTLSSPLCPVATRSLQCLASVAIVNSCVPYQGYLSSHMVKFVDLHKKRGKLTTDIFLVNLLNKPLKGPKFFF
ncbi:FEM1B [Mytilus coruscus]|uniref:FEM1B n=1 Tax=Mytilus coruscus TaxID=42192 RepID=A0A6J8AWZ5_MYTCO|nr:FEM1B [Mytilus coruscus]